MEVIDGRAASRIESILSGALIASAWTLDAADTSQRVLDGGSLAQCGATVGCLEVASKFDEQGFLGMDRNGAALVIGDSALAAELAARAGSAAEASEA